MTEVSWGHRWNGPDSRAILQAAVGKTISSAEFADHRVQLRFTDGTGVRIEDVGQACCESRYITCDDDLSELVGQTLRNIEQRDWPQPPENGGDCHEICALAIVTDRTEATFVTHNEHKGYYGGFSIVLKELAS